MREHASESIWKMRPNPFAAHILHQSVTASSEIHNDKTESGDKKQDMTSKLACVYYL